MSEVIFEELARRINWHEATFGHKPDKLRLSLAELAAFNKATCEAAVQGSLTFSVVGAKFMGVDVAGDPQLGHGTLGYAFAKHS